MAIVAYIQVDNPSGGTILNVSAVDTANVPDWIANDPSWIQASGIVGRGWQWDGTNASAPTEATVAEQQAMADADIDTRLNNSDVDLALAYTMADMWASINSISITQARQDVRARIKTNLRTIRGL